MEVSFSPEEIHTIQSLLKLNTLELRLNPEWGSQSPNYREILYGELNQHLQNISSSSISHTTTLGGFIFTNDPNVQVGFDIELTERVTEEIARRICRLPQEFEGAPFPAALWTAKEAAYKALRGPHQPPVISEISVGDWGVFQSRFETFKFVRQEPRAKFLNCGVVMCKEIYTFSFFAFTT